MINKDETKPLIRLPDLAKFNLSPQETSHLTSALYTIKLDQMFTLATHVSALLQCFEDNNKEKMQNVLRIILVNTEELHELNEIFSLDISKEEEDIQIKRSLREIGLEDEGLYKLIYQFRHKYFLDKGDKVKDNPLAFKERISERLLMKGHSHVSKYLKGGCQLTNEQKEILNKVYPEAELSKKVFRREAHLDISLTLWEIQCLIVGMINKMISTGSAPQENVSPCLLTPKQNRLYDFYTQENAFRLIENDDFATLKGLVSINSPVRNYYTGTTLLMHAIKLQSPEAVSFLLECGVDVNRPDLQGYTALHLAVEGSNEEIFQAILSALNCNVNAEDRGGYTAIYLAAEMGKTTYVKKLLEKAADPNKAKNRYLSSPLHVAVRNGHIAVVKVLLDSGKLNINQKDKNGNDALALASNKNIEIAALIKNYLVRLGLPVASVQKGKQPVLPNRNPTPAAASSTNNLSKQAIREGVAAILLNAKKYKDNVPYLGGIDSSLFPYTAAIQEPVQKITDSFQSIITNEFSILNEHDTKFNAALKQLAGIQMTRTNPAKCYAQIVKLLEQVQREGISLLAFSLQLCRFGHMIHLANLEDKKSVLQVAIEYEDVGCITSELLEKKDFSYRISFKQKEMTELEVAIVLGKTVAVKTMLAVAEQNKDVNLGIIPKNALKQAEERAKELTDVNPAFVEADDHFDIDIPEASRKNNIELLRKLSESIPVDSPENINGLFTIQEYKVLRVLIGDKKEERLHSGYKAPLLKKIVQKVIWFKKLRERIEQFKDNSDINSLQENQMDLEAFAYLQMPSFQNKKTRHQIYSITQDEPSSKNIFKHATNNYADILESGMLSTVDEVLKNGKTRISGTPQGIQKNIFFSQNSELALTTSFRSRAKHIIKLDIASAVQDKLICANDVYTSPHLSAFLVERVDTPIVFIGSDPSKKTIYRVYHGKNEGHDIKVHWYDYYQDTQLLSSFYEIKPKENEFFVGDNIKTTAYRFIHAIRNLKGPFTEGSYYHYILENAHDIKIIDSAKAAIFNVLNVEGKIGKSFSIHHPAIQIVENEKAKHLITITPTITRRVNNLIKNDKVQELKNLINDFGMNKDQLSFAIIKAIELQKIEMLKCLCELGVPVIDHNNKALNLAINLLEYAYLSNKRTTKNPEFATAYQIVLYLLNVGYTDENDPSHIRYVASLDNFGKINSNTWTKMTQLDLQEIQQLLFSFDDFSIQKFFMENISKHLRELYNFTFDFGFFELHEFIATRLKISPRTRLESTKRLQTAVENNEISFIKDKLIALSQDQLSLGALYFVYCYAIKLDKVSIVEMCHPYFENTRRYKIYPGLHLALKFKQAAVAEYFLYQRKDIFAKNFLKQSADAVAILNDMPQVLEILREQGGYNILLDDKETWKSNNFVLIIQHAKTAVPKLIADKSKTNVMIANPLISVIETQNALAFKNLLPIYRSSLETKPSTYRNILFLALDAALKSNNYNIFDILLDEMTVNQKAFTAFFLGNTDKVRHLAVVNRAFSKIIENGSVEFLQITIDKLSEAPNRLKKLASQYGGDHLDVALKSGSPDKIRLVKEVTPNIKITDFDDQHCDNLIEIAVKNFDVKYIEFLIQEGVRFPQSATKRIRLCTIACGLGKTAVLRWLVEKGDLAQYVSVDGKNLLQEIFSMRKNLDSMENKITIPCIDYLINEAGQDINHQDRSGKTLLLQLIASRSAISTIEYLLTLANVNCVLADNNHQTILHHFDYNESWNDKESKVAFFSKIVNKYLSQGGDINAKDSQGFTPLESVYNKHLSERDVLTSREGYFEKILTKQGALARQYIIDDSFAQLAKIYQPILERMDLTESILKNIVVSAKELSKAPVVICLTPGGYMRVEILSPLTALTLAKNISGLEMLFRLYPNWQITSADLQLSLLICDLEIFKLLLNKICIKDICQTLDKPNKFNNSNRPLFLQLLKIIAEYLKSYSDNDDEKSKLFEWLNTQLSPYKKDQRWGKHSDPLLNEIFKIYNSLNRSLKQLNNQPASKKRKVAAVIEDEGSNQEASTSTSAGKRTNENITVDLPIAKKQRANLRGTLFYSAEAGEAKEKGKQSVNADSVETEGKGKQPEYNSQMKR